jgi:hypothetical protein
VSVDPGHRAVWVSPDPGPTPGQGRAANNCTVVG